MTTILLVCLGLILVPFALAPLLIRATHKSRARPVFEAVELDTRPIPEEPWWFFQRTLNALQSAGFRESGYLHQEGQMPNVETWVLLLENRPAQEAAIAVAMHSTAAVAVQSRYVEFSTTFEDGVNLSANNSDVLPVFASVPEHHLWQFPGASDPTRLLGIHQALVARLANRTPRRYPPEGEFKAFLEDSMARELARQVGTGYLFLDPEGTFYRPTWKGAFLMTWKLLWPVTNLLKARRRKRSAQALAELGI